MSLLDSTEADSHGYFVPMIDMLAGVIFILIIMLAAVSLVSRNDFPTTEKQKAINEISSQLRRDSVSEQQIRELANELAKNLSMQAEIDRITAELARDRKLDATYLEPRRRARAALTLLLQRLQKALAGQGIRAEIFPDDGRLVVSRSAVFADGVSLSTDGAKVASALAGALAAEMPCLGRSAPATAACKAYLQARLDAVTVVVTGTAGAGRDGQSEARALTLLSAIAADRPALLMQQAVDRHRLLEYRAVEVLPVAAPEEAVAPGVGKPLPTNAAAPGGGNPPPASGAASAAAGTPAPVAGAATGSAAGPAAPPTAGTIELAFKMNVPRIPAK